MAQYGGEHYMKKEGHQTDEHVQNQLHSTTAGQNIGGTGTNMGMGGGHGCKEGKQGVVEKIKENLPGGDHGVNEHMTHDTTTGQNIGGTGTNMGMGGGNGCKEGKQGVVEKIKEKMPGDDHGADKHTTHASDTVGGGEYGNVGEDGHEKKGLAGKIKDKLPGGGNQ